MIAVLKNVVKTLDLTGGGKIVLLDLLAATEREPVERARNIAMLDPLGRIVWRVSSDFDASGDPFTNILFQEGALRGYRWDGGMYTIDIKSGKATPSLFIR
jgi:hypothetical protein